MNDTPIASDILRGIKAISEFLGETERRVYYLAETKQIPAFKVGAIWHCRKSELQRRYSGEAA